MDFVGPADLFGSLFSFCEWSLVEVGKKNPQNEDDHGTTIVLPMYYDCTALPGLRLPIAVGECRMKGNAFKMKG